MRLTEEQELTMEMAKVGYESYAAYTGNKSAVTGDDLPTWYELPGAVRNAWFASAQGMVMFLDTNSKYEKTDRKELYGKEREKPVYYFDIDGTITNETEGWDYAARTPNLRVIEEMHKLHKSSTIILWTSRIGIDRGVTIEWLNKHKVPYDDLIMDKPFWDMYVCDKSMNVNSWRV